MQQTCISISHWNDILNIILVLCHVHRSYLVLLFFIFLTKKYSYGKLILAIGGRGGGNKIKFKERKKPYNVRVKKKVISDLEKKVASRIYWIFLTNVIFQLSTYWPVIPTFPTSYVCWMRVCHYHTSAKEMKVCLRLHFKICYFKILLNRFIARTFFFRLAAQNCSDVKLNPSSSPGELLAYLTHPCFYDKHTSPLHGFNKSETDRINFKLHVYYFKQKPGPSLVSIVSIKE